MKAAKPIIVLTLIAAAAAALLSLVSSGTQAARDTADRNFKLASLEQVLPAYANEPDTETIDAQTIGGKPVLLYPARGPGGEYVGVAVELNSMPAYGGVIALLVGVDAERRVSGLKVLPGHQETPGLGTKAMEEDWVSQFHGQSLSGATGAWKVRKDDPAGMIDEVTGATITSRAMTATVHEALMVVESSVDSIPGAVPEPPPAEQEADAQEEASKFSVEGFRHESLEQVLPPFDNHPDRNAIEVELEGGAAAILYPARLENQLVGVAVELDTPPGYVGALNIIVGVDLERKVTGVRVFPGHEETPGSGDLVEDVAWLDTFKGASLDGQGKAWKCTGDDPDGVVDEITGATITCRAVIEGVRNALEVIAGNWDRLS